MSLTLIRKSSLVRAIAEQREEAIIDGTYTPDDKLPSLQQLQKIVGASQGTLRILEHKGLIEIRLGIKGGAFIRESSTESITEGLGLLIRQRTISYSEIAVFRKVVEASLMELVVQNATPENVDLLKQKVLEMQPFASRGTGGWQTVLDIELEIRKLLIKIPDNKSMRLSSYPFTKIFFSMPGNCFQLKTFYPRMPVMTGN